MAIDLEKITPELIERAVQESDIDVAFAMMQDAAGIADGGIAGLVCSGARNHEWWPTASADERKFLVSDWIEAEQLYLE